MRQRVLPAVARKCNPNRRRRIRLGETIGGRTRVGNQDAAGRLQHRQHALPDHIHRVAERDGRDDQAVDVGEIESGRVVEAEAPVSVRARKRVLAARQEHQRQERDCE